MKTDIIVQARMGSNRLPGKVLAEINGRPLLSYLIDQLTRVEGVDNIVIATTDLEEDLAIVDYCESVGVKYFRGSSHDVLKRYADAARLLTSDIVVRVTADCPLVDPGLISGCLHYIKTHNCDYVCNTIYRKHPRGMDFEIFTSDLLYCTDNDTDDGYDREHVTPYMIRILDEVDILDFRENKDYSNYRVTVDEPKDLEALKLLIEALGTDEPISISRVINTLNNRPDIVAINKDVEQTNEEF